MSVKSKITTTFVMTVALSFSTYAQEPPATTSGTAAESAGGTISGRVLNESGHPLPGATIFVRAVNSLTQGRSTASDLEGNFQVKNLDSALYTVSAMLPAYTSALRDPSTPPIYYRLGDTVRVELIRGGVITGTITNNTGEPVVAVRVRAYMVRDAKGEPTRGQTLGFGERPTDDRGVYRIWGLRPGTYLVFAGGTGNPGSFATGAYDMDAPTYAPSSTRDSAAEIVVRGGEESNADIRYRAEPGRIVSGTLKGQGRSGANITLTPAGIGSLPSSGTFLLPDSRGFAFYGVADGDYDVVAQESSSPQSTSMPEMATSEPLRITVKGADVTGLELTTRPMASISGQISLEPSKVPECQGKRRPVLGETIVELRRNPKNTRNEPAPYLALFGGSASLDKDGGFVLRNLRAGQYTFNPRFYARYWFLQSITMASSTSVKSSQTSPRIDAMRNWTTVKLGDRITGLVVTIAEGAASIRGRVIVGENTKLPANLRIYLVPSEREKGEDILRYFVAEAGDDGTFTLNNLPPGRYWPIAQIPVEADLAADELRLPDSADSRAKLRRAAETSNVEIELRPCQNVTDYRLPFRVN